LSRKGTLLQRHCISLKRNITVNALASADIMLTVRATFEVSPPAKRVKNLATIRNNGAPGGCPTCILNAERINSPQSQKLTVG
jgi:hypothetical protein